MALTDKDLERMAEENITLSNKILKESKRTAFAAAALTGLLARGGSFEDVHHNALLIANRMVAESEKQ